MKTTNCITFAFLFGAALFAQDHVPVRSAVAPHYPAIAVNARVDGEVTVVVKVASGGTVLSASAISGPPLLRKASEDTAKKWQFESGSEAERSVRLIFKYVLLCDDQEPSTDVSFLPPYQVVVEMHPAKPYVSYGELDQMSNPNAKKMQGSTALHESSHLVDPPSHW